MQILRREECGHVEDMFIPRGSESIKIGRTQCSSHAS